MIYRFLFIALLISSCNTDEKTSSMMELELEPTFEIRQIATLDSSITESSGITRIDNNLFTHNDIRGTAKLLEIDLDGSIKSTHNYENIFIRDWEDIATDEDFIYIGDIGNNLGNKTDLKVFKFPLGQVNNQNPTVEIIEFKFADQTDFDNTELNQTSYDVEAVTSLDDFLYVFTKDWQELNTNVYRLNKNAGTYSLSPMTTLNTGGLVTGATTSPEGDIILCGYSRALSPFVARVAIEDGGPIIKRKVDITGMLGTGSQIEGITYAGIIDGTATYYLTSEKFTRTIAGNEITLPAQLYELKWND